MMILVRNADLQYFAVPHSIEASPWFSHLKAAGSDFVGELNDYDYPEKPWFHAYCTKTYAMAHGIKWNEYAIAAKEEE